MAVHEKRSTRGGKAWRLLGVLDCKTWPLLFLEGFQGYCCVKRGLPYAGHKGRGQGVGDSFLEKTPAPLPDLKDASFFPDSCVVDVF